MCIMCRVVFPVSLMCLGVCQHISSSWGLLISQGDSFTVGATSKASGAPPSSSLRQPMGREEDMKRFSHAGLMPAVFLPMRHVYMCCGRPMVVLEVMLTWSPCLQGTVTSWGR